MEPQKHTDRQDRILNAAFEEWGKVNYTNTSLTILAKRLELTKPALYRHFPSKEALLRAMELRFLTDYADMHRLYLERVQGFGIADAVRLFVTHQFRFFYENKYYYIFFLIQMLRTPLRDRPEFQRIMAAQTILFKNLFAGGGRKASADELFVRLHFLYVASIYWFSRNFFDCSTGFATARDMSEVEIEREIERTYAFCIHGILKDPRWVPTDYGAIEKSAAILAEEMLPLDRIFTAIEEVIAETGIKDASVDKIAAKIGMSKSSLYFYFKNRDEMLGKMIEREQAHVSALLKSRMQGIEGFPAKSFCYMVVTASYSLNNPALLTVFNWLRFQNIDVAVKPPDVAFMLDYFSFISEAYDEDILIGNKSDMLQAASFLHILSFRIVMDLRTLGVGYEAIMERLRNFHNLYLYGFLADKLTDEECL